MNGLLSAGRGAWSVAIADDRCRRAPRLDKRSGYPLCEAADSCHVRVSRTATPRRVSTGWCGVASPVPRDPVDCASRRWSTDRARADEHSGFVSATGSASRRRGRGRARPSGSPEATGPATEAEIGCEDTGVRAATATSASPTHNGRRYRPVTACTGGSTPQSGPPRGRPSSVKRRHPRRPGAPISVQSARLGLSKNAAT